jgi:hypothetical protein
VLGVFIIPALFIIVEKLSGNAKRTPAAKTEGGAS